jgi:hypothetical protein
MCGREKAQDILFQEDKVKLHTFGARSGLGRKKFMPKQAYDLLVIGAY